jgi:hypothetical protein
MTAFVPSTFTFQNSAGSGTVAGGEAVWITHVAPLWKEDKLRFNGEKQKKKMEYLADSRGYLVFLCDVSRVKWDIVVSLNDIEDRDNVSSCDELFNDVSAQETRADNNEVDVLHDRVRPTCKFWISNLTWYPRWTSLSQGTRNSAL